MADLKEHQLEAIKGAFKEIQYFVEDLDHANGELVLILSLSLYLLTHTHHARTHTLQISPKHTHTYTTDLIPLGGVPVIMDCLQDSNKFVTL